MVGLIKRVKGASLIENLVAVSLISIAMTLLMPIYLSVERGYSINGQKEWLKFIATHSNSDLNSDEYNSKPTELDNGLLVVNTQDPSVHNIKGSFISFYSNYE